LGRQCLGHELVDGLGPDGRAFAGAVLAVLLTLVLARGVQQITDCP